MKKSLIICMLIFLLLVGTNVFAVDKDSELNITCAIVSYQQGDLNTAETFLKTEEDNNSKDARVYYYLGMINFDRNHFDIAEKYYLKAINLNPNYGEVYNELCTIRIYQNKVEEAKKYIEKSLSLNPKDASAYMNYANIFTLQGDNEKSKEQVYKAAKLNPNVVINHGAQFLLRNDPNSAFYYFNIAEEFAPEEPILLFNMGQAYRLLKDYIKGLQYLESAYNKASKDYYAFGVIYSTYFRFLLDTGSYDNIYKRVFEKVDNEYPSACLFLALADYKSNKMDDFNEQAKKYFQYSKETIPSSLDEWAKKMVLIKN